MASRLINIMQRLRDGQPGEGVHVASTPSSGSPWDPEAPWDPFDPPWDPLDRLHDVTVGIAQLADDLEDTGILADSLRRWSIELTSIQAEIKQRYQPKPVS